MVRYLFLAAALLAGAPSISPSSTQAPRPVTGAAPLAPAELSAGARRGLAFAEQRCSACHAVLANTASPHPESPPFQDVANRPGVTAGTLRQFLRSSHNYPAAMNFEVEDAEIDNLADYIVTLRKADYRPVM